MQHQSRRAILLAGVSALTLAASRALANSSKEEAADLKAQFVRAANEQWKRKYERALAQAREAEKRGEFSSLSPPTALVPFKDWDYYYTQGFSLWRPNPGQNYDPVQVPEGFVTDLASVPQWVWSVGIRPEGPYAYAAVIHDYLYWTQERTRKESDDIFLHAMEDSKVDEGLRNRIHAAVRLAGGSAWATNQKLKQDGEKRLLKSYPDDFTISWSEWKSRPGVFRD